MNYVGIYHGHLLTETGYGVAMRTLARVEGHTPKLPVILREGQGTSFGPQTYSHVSVGLMAAEGKSYREVAAAHNAPKGTLNSWLQRNLTNFAILRSTLEHGGVKALADLDRKASERRQRGPSDRQVEFSGVRVAKEQDGQENSPTAKETA